jgi:transposase
VTGARRSTGWVSSVLTAIADMLVDVEKLIKTLITLAHVIHVDETSSNINGRRWWLHVASTDTVTAYHLTAPAAAPRWRSSTSCRLPGHIGPLADEYTGPFSWERAGVLTG